MIGRIPVEVLSFEYVVEKVNFICCLGFKPSVNFTELIYKILKFLYLRNTLRFLPNRHAKQVDYTIYN